MSNPVARTCSVCGFLAESTTEHMIHVTNGHPELNRTAQRERRAAGNPSPAARPFSCWRCAALIPATQPDRRCICGWQHPGFKPDTGQPLERQEYPEGLATCDNCGKVEHTPEELAICIDSMLSPVVDRALTGLADYDAGLFNLDHRGRPR